MKIITKILILILLQFVFTKNLTAFEKVGTTSFQFLKIITTARAIGMGGACSSLSLSSESVFWNPAGLTTINSFAGSVGYADWFMDVTHYSFSAAYSFDGIGTFAFFGAIGDVGEIQETKVSYLGYQNGVYNPGLTGNTFNPKSIVFGVSYAKDLTDRFTFGINVKYAYEDLIYYSKGELIFDGGMLFRTNFRSIMIGASIRNFGSEVTYIDRNYPLPQTLNVGVSAFLFSDDDPIITSLGNNSLLCSFDLVQPRDYNQQYALGLEYSFNKMFFLRGGYLFNTDEQGINLGIGLSFVGTSLDYTYSDYGEFLGGIHRVTLSVELK